MSKIFIQKVYVLGDNESPSILMKRRIMMVNTGSLATFHSSQYVETPRICRELVANSWHSEGSAGGAVAPGIHRIYIGRWTSNPKINGERQLWWDCEICHFKCLGRLGHMVLATI